MERIAVMDIGSLRAKLTIVDVDDRHNLNQISRYRTLTHLGQDLASGEQKISHTALNNTIEKLRDFKERCQETGVNRIFAVATQAIREAVNQHEVLLSFQEVLNTQLQVLSKDKEADLFFKAVAYDCRRLGKIVTIEVGGGSVQLAIGTLDKTDFKASIRTGTAVLHERFTNTEKKQRNYATMTRFVYDELKRSGIAEFSHNASEVLVYGSACMQDFFHEACIPMYSTGPSVNHDDVANVRDIESFYHGLQDMSWEDQGKFFPSDPPFMIGADKSLLNVLVAADLLGINSVVPSNFSISEGIVIDQL